MSDGVAFRRTDLERLLGLKRFKGTRVKWMLEDLKEFFPFVQYYSAGANESLSSVFVARVPIAEVLPKGKMTTKKRINAVPSGGPHLALFELWQVPDSKSVQEVFEGLVPFFGDAANYDERFLASYLSLLSQGMISPRSLPPLKPGKDDE